MLQTEQSKKETAEETTEDTDMSRASEPHSTSEPTVAAGLRSGEWTDNLAVQGIANILNINIRVINTITPDWIHDIHPRQRKSDNTITIGLMGELHYVALENVSTETERSESEAARKRKEMAEEEDRIAFDRTSKISLRLTQGKTFKNHRINAGLLKCPDNVQTMLRNDTAFRFLKNVRGSPAYWNTILLDLLAMVRQLGTPTWFLTLSAADMQWPEIIQSIAFQYRKTLTDDDMKNMQWEDKCKWLHCNPVTAARQFQHRLDLFFMEFIGGKANPIGKLQDYMIRTDFQARGSPHAHTILWIKDALKIDVNTDEEVISFIDKFQTCAIPEEEEDPDLRSLNVAEECRADDLKAKLRKVGSAFLNNREISAQEAVYRLMPMPLKKASRKVVFVNSAPKDKWVSILRPKRLLQEMDNNDENIFCTSPLDRYASRPNELENMCMAEFVQTLANTYTNTGKDATDEATDHIPDVLDGSDVNEAGEQEDEDAEAESRYPSHTTLQNGLITAPNFMPVFQQSLGKH
ncbi:hypothetical protein Pmani_001775 [Petrolisthes manimaculis]|uniref:Helitron helicase-like domain-containing protein n=1 Tax=Petrolisthes manimaculis TaxID=1843537 RepID=A0AAE1QLK5_9EUCA|nr:hypothetical protein Pmani_001775 [Petrolisthes manimaculis]